MYPKLIQAAIQVLRLGLGDEFEIVIKTVKLNKHLQEGGDCWNVMILLNVINRAACFRQCGKMSHQ